MASKLTLEQKRKKDREEVLRFYNENGRPPIIKDYGNKSRAMINRNGSWNDLIKSAGLEPHRIKNNNEWTKESLAELAKKESANNELSWGEFTKRNLAVKLFGSWDSFLEYTELNNKIRSEPNHLNKPFTKYTFEELLGHLRVREKELGRPPTVNDVSIFPYYVDKFGSWNNALRLAGIKGKYGWKRYTKSQLVNLAQQQCDKNGYLSTSEFTHYYQAVKLFGDWETFKKQAGLRNKHK